MSDKMVTVQQLTVEMLAHGRFDDEKSFLAKTGAQTIQEAFGWFEGLEADASTSLGICRQELQRAILSLYEIRDKALWIFSGKPSWTQYLEDWCAQEKISPSGIKAYLAGVRVWVGGLHRSIEDLAQIEDGIGVARNLIDRSNGSRDPPIDHYNPATGEIVSLNSKWVPLLSGGDTPADMVNTLIDEEVSGESTGATFLYSMQLRLLAGKDERDNASQTDTGRLTVVPCVQGQGNDKTLIGFKWELWQKGKRTASGREMFASGTINRHPRARELLLQKFGHSWTGG